MEIKCSVMAIFYAYVLEREVVSKSTLFGTKENTVKNSTKIYGQGVLGSPITNPYILKLRKED